MINLEIGKTNVVENEESNVLNENKTNSDSLPENYIPSYVGLSCAVSGYRSINKYDGAVREHSSANLTPSLNLFSGHCKDRPSNFDNEYSENLIPNTSSNVITKEELPSVNNIENTMNISSSKEAFTSHKFVSLEQVTNLNSPNSIQITTKNLSCFTQSVDQNNGKSFVQQRIERLYGPSALGIGFQARRSFLERLKDEERKEGKEEPNNVSTLENNKQFPSVFRHLRPEFRHQLPVRSKLNYPREVSNGFLDKTNTNSTNGLNSREPNKTWKSLSKELESVCKVVETDNLNPKPVNSLNHSSSNECQNNESTKASFNLKDSPTNIQDGNYYLKIVALEVACFEPQIEKIENDLKLQENLMSEEVKGKLLAASGKAKLLISQKVEQFKGLCFKNINNTSSDEFATTNEDLAGFWDMVKIQVEDVKDLFKEIDELRLNNWKEIKEQVTKNSDSLPVKKCNTTKKLKSSGKDIAKNTKSDKVDSSGDERRKQMREALNAKRKQAMKIKNSTKTDSDIEIFIQSK